MARTFQVVSLVLFLATVVGCGDGASSALFKDSPLDLPVVLNEAPAWLAEDRWSVGSEPTLEVVRNEIDPVGRNSGIQSAFRFPDGRTVVADGTSQAVLFFGRGGNPLRVVSGPDDAPGEFQGLEALFLLPGDSLVVFDEIRTRVTILDSEGSFSRSVKLKGAVSPSHAVGVTDDGRLVVAGNPSISSQQLGLHVDSTTLVRYDLVSGQPDTVGAFPARERFMTEKGGERTMGERPFGRVLSSAIVGDRLCLGTGVPYKVLVFSAEGLPELEIRRMVKPRSVTRGDRKRYVEWRTSSFRGPEAFTVRAREVLSSRATPYPRTMLAFDRFLADPEGNLWVREYAPPWEQGGRDWSVFNIEGNWLGVVRVPATLEVLQVGQDFLLGIGRDEPNVESILIFELLKPSPKTLPTG